MNRQTSILVVALAIAAAALPSGQGQDQLTAAALKGLEFRSIGPGFTSGRVQDVEIDPKNTNIWYVTSAFGGLWKSRTEPSANRAAAVLRVVAMTLGRGRTALGAFYRRLAARKGKPHAVTATARKLAILVYRVLKGELVYPDPGAEAYHAQQRTRRLRQIRDRAAAFGYDLVQRHTGEIIAAPV